MENTNSIMFEMRVLQDLRKMTPEQRTEIFKSIQNEEELEKEALKKNPNLLIERQLQQMYNEIKELKQDIKNIQNSQYNDTLPCIYRGASTIVRASNNCIADSETYTNTDTDTESCIEGLNSYIWWFLFITFLIIVVLSPSKSNCRPVVI